MSSGEAVFGFIARRFPQLSPVSLFPRIVQSRGVHAVCIRAAVVLTGFLPQLMLARTLRISEFGIYACAFSVVQLFALIARGGLDTAALRFVAIYRHSNDSRYLAGFIRCMLFSTVSLMVLAAAGHWMFMPWWTTPTKDMVVSTLLLLPALTVGLLLDAVVRSLGGNLRGLVGPIVANLSLAAALGTAAVCNQLPTTASEALFVQALATLPAIALSSWFVVALLPPDFNWSDSRVDYRGWLKATLPLFVFSLVVYMQSRMGPVLAQALFGNESAALFAAAERVAILTTFGLQSLNQISAPDYAVLYHSAARERLQAAVTRATRFGLVFALAASFVFVIFGRQILMLFGSRFSDGYSILLLLTLGAAMNAGTGPVHYLLTMTGHSWASVSLLLAGTAVSALVLSGLSAISMGVVAVPLAISLGMTASNIGATILVYRTLQIWSLPFGFRFHHRLRLKGLP